MDEREKLIKAREILQKIANGINPISGQAIDKESFLDDPRIIRCFFYISDVLNRVIDGQISRNSPRPATFSISEEEKRLVREKLPNENIGVNEFARCVNNIIDLNRSKKLTGVELNKQLKKMGLLSEQKLADGKTRTTINDKSVEYGMQVEKRNYNGNEYDMVVFNDQGKRYLLDNLDEIMNK